ncbi:hypothetical protein TIFTF001_030408 [Ficus carica]|uniref:Uncharacterized protein n=1 Tax=Ficus carica TaxID=3494 RepID=A0AA88DTN0_FICCA|nr:hypothetical protein TIFTF001_030408 [Ficus carica]
MPPKKKTPTPAPTPLGKPSKFPINPTVSPPPSSTPRILPHQLLQFHQPLSPLLSYPLLQANKVQHLLKRSDASVRNRDKLPHVRRDSGNIAKAIEGGMKESNGDTTPVKYVVLLDNE